MKTFIKFFVISIIILSTTACFAEIPHLINYQGKLADSAGKPVTDGTYSVTFRIFDAEVAGNLLWEEVQTLSAQKGIFSVMLGGVTALNLVFDKPYWLEIKVGSEVMSPRQRMASVGYAYAAEYGVPRGVIVMWSGKIKDIPSGWGLCDGSKGTPDLRDRFIVGARQDDGEVPKTNVTGALTQSGDGQMPAHSHNAGTLTNGAHTHNLQYWSGWQLPNGSPGYANDPFPASNSDYANGWSNDSRAIRIDTSGAVPVTGSTATAGSGTKNIAIYYALAYITKL